MKRPTIKLVDERGRKVCAFRQTPAHGHAVTPDEARGGVSYTPAMAGRGGPYWTVVDNPLSRKLKRHIQPQLDVEGHALIPRLGGPRNDPVTYEAGLPVLLDVPGLSLRWEKVVDVLNSLAAEDDMVITVKEFRRRVSN